jgi:ABC-2 type transport system permease protein
MMLTLIRIAWLNLKRDRVAQALTFALPIIFFSIFATVFGNQGDRTGRIRVAVVDEDRSEFSRKLVRALQQEGGLRVRTTADAEGKGAELTRAGAEDLVKNGGVPVAIVLPKSLGGEQRFWTDQSGSQPTVQLLADVSDPIAPQVVQGLLQKVSFTAAPETMAVEGLSMFEKYSGPLTTPQRKAVDHWLAEMKKGQGGQAAGPGPSAAEFGLRTEIVNVMQPGEGPNTTVSFYAAGIGVMFLLFSCAGAGGTLLEEEENGTLGRLVGSRAGMGGVLLGKWLFITLVGILQLTVMFTWGAVMFRLPLASHLPGFFVMTIVTAAAASAFGLVLATLSRSRAQLSGISTILILTMSAVGGSMFPRFLMSETMQKVGLGTFNSWALDGYLKVFWREAPIPALWPQVLVLLGLAAAFLSLARLFARRWETL